MQNPSYEAVRELILDELSVSLSAIRAEEVEQLIEAVLQARRVFFVGVGRVLLSLQAVAKRWAHLGIDTHIVGEITEPAITKEDLLIVGSGSGTTLFPAGIAQKAHSLGAKVVHIGSNPNSPLSDIAAFMVRIPVRTKYYLEDEIDSAQPMTSLFEQTLLLLGDVVAKMIIDRQGLDIKGLWRHHANLE
ncbi:MAG TPA: 6-phospho-3-hexuloisomerase [Feifaniaceae bacterium]|nr:6-phospho-3-hexuloisomerase [Feifaniaceae bacterium]